MNNEIVPYRKEKFSGSTLQLFENIKYTHIQTIKYKTDLPSSNYKYLCSDVCIKSKREKIIDITVKSSLNLRKLLCVMLSLATLCTVSIGVAMDYLFIMKKTVGPVWIWLKVVWLERVQLEEESRKVFTIFKLLWLLINVKGNATLQRKGNSDTHWAILPSLLLTDGFFCQIFCHAQPIGIFAHL
jgi:hypothetical protein